MKQKSRKAAAEAEEKFLAACSLSEQRRWRDAHKLFLAAAKAGHSGAQLNVGNLFYDGEGTRKSRHKALYWYRKAAARGYGAAASNIGIVYKDEGRWRLALRWFEKAVALGDHDAMLEMAKIYAGPLADPLKAKRLLAKVLSSKQVTVDSQEQAQSLLQQLR